MCLRTFSFQIGREWERNETGSQQTLIYAQLPFEQEVKLFNH